MSSLHTHVRKHVRRTDSLSQRILKSSVGIINSNIQIECSSICERTLYSYVGLVQYYHTDHVPSNTQADASFVRKHSIQK